MRSKTQVAPQTLSNWFVVHFIADLLFAVPMMLIPEQFLSWLGWQTIDPIATRLVAAALFGIGIESWLGRNASLDTFKNMLNLKIIWSLGAVVGIGVSLIGGAQGSPLMGWLVFTIFLAFNILWVYWRVKLQGLTSSRPHDLDLP
ncbi:MAG: hypothetical protein JXB38_20775 [Anaerolineales bacterium]|nr:hypothetical protein [Anaerolineales bacterium]